MYSEEKPALEDLVHYGVKGMKWGVRKDRDSVKAAKLEKYRKKEQRKVSSRYNKEERLHAKVTNNPRSSQKRKQKSQLRLDMAKARNTVESQYLKRMTYVQMQGEKKTVAKQFVKSTLVNIGSIPITALTGFTVVSVPKVSNIKYNYRVKET